MEQKAPGTNPSRVLFLWLSLVVRDVRGHRIRIQGGQALVMLFRFVVAEYSGVIE